MVEKMIYIVAASDCLWASCVVNASLDESNDLLLQAVRKWKHLGKVLCRLLRMSDYWYGFASDVALSSEERAIRRVSVLHQVQLIVTKY